MTGSVLAQETTEKGYQTTTLLLYYIVKSIILGFRYTHEAERIDAMALKHSQKPGDRHFLTNEELPAT